MTKPQCVRFYECNYLLHLLPQDFRHLEALGFFLVKQSPHIVTKGGVLASIALYHFKKDYFVECLPQNYFYQNSSFLHTQVDSALVFTVSNPNTIPVRIMLLKDRPQKLWGSKRNYHILVFWKYQSQDANCRSTFLVSPSLPLQ